LRRRPTTVDDTAGKVLNRYHARPLILTSRLPVTGRQERIGDSTVADYHPRPAWFERHHQPTGNRASTGSLGGLRRETHPGVRFLEGAIVAQESWPKPALLSGAIDGAYSGQQASHTDTRNRKHDR
jgi:hypothetical protein